MVLHSSCAVAQEQLLDIEYNHDCVKLRPVCDSATVSVRNISAGKNYRFEVCSVHYSKIIQLYQKTAFDGASNMSSEYSRYHPPYHFWDYCSRRRPFSRTHTSDIIVQEYVCLRLESLAGGQEAMQTSKILVAFITGLALKTLATNLIIKELYFNPKVRNEANVLLQKFLSFETILVAMVFMLIFEIMTPPADYLQTKKTGLCARLEACFTAQNKLEVARASKVFSSVMARLLDEEIESNHSLEAENLYLELELQSKRVRKIKKIPGELADDEESAITEKNKLRIKVFNCIIDKRNQSMRSRFDDHKNLYLDLSCFDLTRFSELKKGDWPQISSPLTEKYTTGAHIESDSESETSEEIVQNEARTYRMEDPCKGCIN
ncbi:hypothetical protein PR048_024204 [Dryococelus australis]|uniref:Uncharacterized protein n=1 Tax=Dryococelus australis TaxID=614101 RepID=A0ABQ9GWC5_9NEOP|nr:hypothetical protein PR048_024204 [Dryococelus australis]